jgi:hypothetical protein
MVGALASGGGAFGAGTTFQIGTDTTGATTDVDFDEIVVVTPLTIIVTAVSGIVTTVFATSMVLAGCADLYRTRNRDAG